jgi:hypothetical protein
MDKYLNSSEYCLFSLVGNKYCQKKPSGNDKKIKLIYEKNNPFDKNAIKIVSIRDDIYYHLGYIDKAQTHQLKIKVKNKEIKFKAFIRKMDNVQDYYYLLFKNKK